MLRSGERVFVLPAVERTEHALRVADLHRFGIIERDMRRIARAVAAKKCARPRAVTPVSPRRE